MSLKVTVKRHALDQCEILVAGRRVAYMCYGQGAKLNWLQTKYLKESGDQLTVDEKVSIAEFARSTMEKLTKQRSAKSKELADLIGDDELPADFFEHDPVESTVGGASSPKSQEKK